MTARFLFNQELWTELRTRLPKAKRARAAVAYLGTGASTLLPLREGNVLVVDMSLRSVRAGTTNPHEVKKYLERGVEVFSRDCLHAKFFILDNVTIAGSSNISSHAEHVLDEAAILTDDAATSKRAREVFSDLCNEPVRAEYLQQCIDAYRPPKFVGSPRRASTAPAKVWLIGGLTYRDLPEAERTKADRVVERAKRKLRDFENCTVDSTHYAQSKAFFARLRPGDWLLKCIEDGSGYDVHPPARFLGVKSYSRGAGKHRFMLLHEALDDAPPVRWTRFRGALPPALKSKLSPRPRTAPLTDSTEADAVLRLWNARGAFVGHRSRSTR